MGKSQTISINQLTVQLCKAHCPPPDIKLMMGLKSWFVFYCFDFKVWKLLVERGIKRGSIAFSLNRKKLWHAEEEKNDLDMSAAVDNFGVFLLFTASSTEGPNRLWDGQKVL